MAEEITPRFGFKKQTAGTDGWPGRVGFMEILDLIEGNAAMYAEGTYAARPPFGENGRFYYVEGGGVLEGTLWYDNGTAWFLVPRLNPTSSQTGSQSALPIGYNSADDNRGSSNYAARADHSHPYDYGYQRNRFAMMWGTGIGPGMFNGAADDQKSVHTGLMAAAGMDDQFLQIGRAGNYRLTAGFHIEGWSESASPWKTEPMMLTICKGDSSLLSSVLYASSIPAIAIPAQRNIREHQISWAADLVVGDLISAAILLGTNISTSSGTATNAFKYITAELVT